MAVIPVNKKTTEYVIEHSKKIICEQRPHLGMSGLGQECLRKQWYGWHWVKKEIMTVRQRRILDRGHLEEASIITDLNAAGIKVYRQTEDGKRIDLTGDRYEEQELLHGFHDHCLGHTDGRALGVIEAPKTEHLLEMKTMNDKYFKLLNKKGLRSAFPIYYKQMQMYMYKMGLKRGLFVATNKNDQARRYIRVKFVKKIGEQMQEVSEQIIMSELPPPRKFKPEHYLCQWCSFFNICHLKAPVEMNCRTCKYCDLEPKGQWSCSKNKGKILSVKKQRRGCHMYRGFIK